MSEPTKPKKPTRPAQTEQQPVVIPPMVEFDDMVNRLFELDADARKYCARHWLLSMWKATLHRVCELNVAPIAQAAPLFGDLSKQTATQQENDHG